MSTFIELAHVFYQLENACSFYCATLCYTVSMETCASDPSFEKYHIKYRRNQWMSVERAPLGWRLQSLGKCRVWLWEKAFVFRRDPHWEGCFHRIMETHQIVRVYTSRAIYLKSWLNYRIFIWYTAEFTRRNWKYPSSQNMNEN